MNILLADTSTSILSIALMTESTYEERLVDGSFSHSEDLLPEIEALLARSGMAMHELELLIVAKGPGSFTGLRIGMASMKGIASALSIPLVSVPTLDAAAEAVSVGVFAPGRTMLMLGSTAFMISLSDKPDSDKRLWSAPFLFPGMYALIGGMGASGSITKWFLREIRSDMEQSMKSLDRIEEEAAMIEPGADGLLFLPYFCGERTPINDPAARGVFWGLTLHHTKDHLYRAVMEGIGFGILDNFTAMEECGGRIDEVRVVGGGTKSRIFPGLLCTISGKPFLESETMIGASYGDALMAMAASGFCSLKEIDSMIKPSKTIVPELETHAFYKSLFLKYKELWKTTKAICHFSS